MEKPAQKYNDTQKYGGVRIRQFAYADDITMPNLWWLAEKEESYIEAEFEGFNFYIPKDYHWYLTGAFGPHYMDLPDESMRHGVAPVSKIDFGTVFDEIKWFKDDFMELPPLEKSVQSHSVSELRFL